MGRYEVTDSHVHFWDTHNLRYEWLDGNERLNKPYVITDYLQETRDINIEGLIFVQAECAVSQFEDEVKWVSSMAKENGIIKGIVAYVPAEEGNGVRSSIERILKYPPVKGVRRIIQFEQDIDFCVQPKFIEGVRALEDYGLSFDICITHIHLENTIKLVKSCPNINFILDHIGKPDIRNQVFEPWKAQLKTLAEIPNVSCKISGMVTEAAPYNWTTAELKPYVEHVINSFGIDKVMYGGDWPVVTNASAYNGWFEALEDILQGYSAEDKRKLYTENAKRIYRL